MEISNQQPCNGCAWANFITGGYYCNRGRIFVPYGHIGCKLTDDTREAVEQEQKTDITKSTHTARTTSRMSMEMYLSLILKLYLSLLES